MMHKEVQEIQQWLEECGFYTGRTDGTPDPTMKNAISEFQRKKDLDMTGEVDPKTRDALIAELRWRRREYQGSTH